MNSPLDQLVGMRLAATEEAEGSLGLFFDGCTLRGFTRFRSSVPIRELAGAIVTSVSVNPEKCLRLILGPTGDLDIWLAPAHYSGPEAFVAHFSNGDIVAK
jgi:hypothetical protein